MNSPDKSKANPTPTVVFQQELPGEPPTQLQIEAIAGTTRDQGWWTIETRHGNKSSSYSLSRLSNNDPDRVIELLAQEVIARVTNGKFTQLKIEKARDDTTSDQKLRDDATALFQESSLINGGIIDMDKVRVQVEKLLKGVVEESATTAPQPEAAPAPQPAQMG